MFSAGGCAVPNDLTCQGRYSQAMIEMFGKLIINRLQRGWLPEKVFLIKRGLSDGDSRS